MANKPVFISYSSKNRLFANEIVKRIEAEGIGCWKAPEMIPAGSSYAREIPKAIENCKVVLLLLSKSSMESIWVEKEVDRAISNRKNIIPFVIDDSPLNDAFSFYLNNVQMISYHDDPTNALRELKSKLKDYVYDESLDVSKKVTTKEDDKVHISIMPQEYNEVRKENQPAERSPRGNRSRAGKTNALRTNQIPLECEYCGCKILDNTTVGTYVCTACGKENFDDFQKIRNYLDRAGAATAMEIEHRTGVSKKTVDHFFREEYLEIPAYSSVRVSCERCGATIRTGSLCESCKQIEALKSPDSKKGRWHSSL